MVSWFDFLIDFWIDFLVDFSTEFLVLEWAFGFSIEFLVTRLSFLLFDWAFGYSIEFLQIDCSVGKQF